MRRLPVLISVLAVALLGVVGLGRALPTTAQDEANDPSLVGSWTVTVTNSAGMTFPTLSTFSPDGTVMISRLPTEPPLPGAPQVVSIFSTGHGTWEATGPDAAIATYVHLRANSEGQLLGTVTVRISITVGAGGDTYTSQSHATVADATGNVLATFTGSQEATRIVAEAPPEAAATPAA